MYVVQDDSFESANFLSASGNESDIMIYDRFGGTQELEFRTRHDNGMKSGKVMKENILKS